MTVEEKAYNYANKVAKNRLTASEIAAHYGRGYIEGQEDMKHLAPFVCVSNKTWRPASELPVIPEGKFSVSVIAYCNTPSGIYAPVEIAYTRTGGWQYESVKWWCYPPKED